MQGDAPGLLERRLADAGFECVAGVDEVGRGALAGPLVAAAVILPPGKEIPGLKDSKLCSRRLRERLAKQVRATAVTLSIVRITPDKIDRVGLQRCNLEALRRALNKLEVTPDYVLIDAFRMSRLAWPGLAVKKADAVSRSVAAASIVAKVHRDAIMRRYHKVHPQYGFATNVGYGTAEHWRALGRHGPCSIHRRSFYGVCGWPGDDASFSGRGVPDEAAPGEVTLDPQVERAPGEEAWQQA